MNQNSKYTSRRRFIFQTASTFLAANTAVYVVDSAFKSFDGSLVAGAKTWYVTADNFCEDVAIAYGSIPAGAAPGNPCTTQGRLEGA